MRTVHLHGHLAQFTPKMDLDVQTAAEAIRALSVNFPGFSKALERGSYEIIVGETAQNGRSMDLEDVKEFRLGKSDLHIIPVAAGAKSGGTAKVILGAVLIGAAAFTGYGTLASATLAPKTIMGLTWSNLAFMGLGLTIAGASQLLTKTDGAKKDENDSSYTLSGALNSYEQGNPVPLVYGEVITGGQIISSGIDIEQLKK